MRFRTYLVFTATLTINLLVSVAWAGNLSVAPLDGGNTLRFGSVDPTFRVDKEVRIRVSGYEGRQYQIYQRISQPLVNERGEYLDRNVILSKGSDGSNGSGTLYLNTFEQLRSSDQLIYTSNQSGMTDSFRMLYAISTADINQSGRFNGQILFSVRPVGSGQQEEIVLNVNLEVDEDFELTVRAMIGSDDISLSTNQIDESDAITVSFLGLRRGDLTVRQEMIEPLSNSNGTLLPESSLFFYMMNESDGQCYFPDLTALKYQPTTLYKSDGDSDSVTIYYSLSEDNIDLLEAGNYSGKLRLSIVTDEGLEVKDVDLKVEVAPVFEMDIAYPEGGMSFDRILPSTPPQERVVNVKVKSNLGRAYSVYQNVNAPLANERGDEIDKEYFLVKEIMPYGQTGEVKHPEFVPVNTNQTALFVSDPKGSSAEFQVIYQLKPYKGIKDGDYQAAIVYSLGEH